MPTQEQLLKYSKGMARASLLARRELRSFWSILDKSDMVAVREALEEFFPALIRAYGDAAATVSADWFEELTGDVAFLGDDSSDDAVNARMRWAIGAGFGGDIDQALGTLESVADELVKQFGRDTIVNSSAQNGRRFARVPVGETCNWCRMMGSRGYVYRSTASAGGLSRWHGGHCDCQVIPEDGVKPVGYDPDELYSQYQNAREQEPQDLLPQGDMSDTEYAKRLRLITGYDDNAIAGRMRLMYGGN